MPNLICKTAWGKHLLYGAGVLALFVLLAPGGAGAANLTVDGGATKIVPPSIAFENETIGGTGQGTLLQFSGSNTVSSLLILGDQANGKGTYKLFSGNLSGGEGEIIGNDGIGSFSQFGGTNISLSLTLGQNSGSGTYQLTGGSLLVPFETIGNFGSGTFIQNGGSNTVLGDLTLAQFPGSSGTYRMNTGSLAVMGENEVIGIGGTGSFTQNSGKHTVTKTLTLGLNPSGSGTYNLVSGQLSVGDEIIGGEGTGTFNHTSSNHTVNGSLTLGNGSTGSGAYHLTSGSLMVGVNEFIGNNGSGTFNHTSGNHTVNGNLTLGNSGSGSGTYNLHAGTLQAVNEFIGPDPSSIGIFNQTGGLNRVTNDLVLGVFLISDDQTAYNLTGGILTAKSICIFAGASFNVTNVVTTVTGDVFNQGDVRTTNAIVTWNDNFTHDALRYTSNSSQQTFNKNLGVNPDGIIIATHSQDLFVIKNNFDNQSNQNSDWNTVQATLKFATGADNSHDFYIPGADNGPPGDVPVTAVTDNFAWGTLNIAGQVVHLFDGNDTPGGAQYVGTLIGADVSGIAVNNIVSDPNSLLNIYYDPDLALNFYLGGQTYDLAGGNGQLIPFHTPLPPSVFLLGSGLLGLGLLGWRRRRS